MGTISLQIPQTGLPNSTEDAKVASDFTTLQTLVNGNIDTNNISPTAGITFAQLAAGAGRMGIAVVGSGASSAGSGQLVVVNAGPATVTLPAASLNGLVGVMAVNITGAAPVTVAGAHIYGRGITDVSSFLLGTSGAFAVLQSDGTNWFIISGGPDTGWVPLPLAAGVAALGGHFVPSSRLRGDTVQLKGAMNAVAGRQYPNPWTTVTSTFRPSSTVAGVIQVDSTGASVFQVDTAGVFTIGVTGIFNIAFLDGVSYTLS